MNLYFFLLHSSKGAGLGGLPKDSLYLLWAVDIVPLGGGFPPNKVPIQLLLL